VTGRSVPAVAQSLSTRTRHRCVRLVPAGATSDREQCRHTPVTRSRRCVARHPSQVPRPLRARSGVAVARVKPLPLEDGLMAVTDRPRAASSSMADDPEVPRRLSSVSTAPPAILR
jgi:hypothetical protein